MCLRTHTRNMSDSQKPGTSCEWSKGSQQSRGADARRSSAIPVLPERGQQKRGFVKTHRQEKQAHLESNFQNSSSEFFKYLMVHTKWARRENCGMLRPLLLSIQFLLQNLWDSLTYSLAVGFFFSRINILTGANVMCESL